MDLRARLWSETATLYAQLEALPFVAALQAGTLPAASIVTLLRPRLVSERIAPPLLALTGSESVVLINAPGNHHLLALRILSLWLTGQGVPTDVVGPDEGLDDIVALVSRVRPRLVLISIALPAQRQAVVDVVTAIAALPQSSRPTVCVGGYAVKMGLIEPIPGAELMADIHELSTVLPRAGGTSGIGCHHGSR